MALWTVQNQPWPPGVFGRLDPIDVLIEYDGPLAFTSRNALGNPVLAYLCDAEADVRRFVVAPTNDRIIGQLKVGARSIRGAIDQPILWLVDVGRDGNVIDYWSPASISELPPDALPEPDVMLYPRLEPLIRLRAMGQSIHPGTTPAAVVRSLTAGAENAVRRLVNFVESQGEAARRIGRHKGLPQLAAQQFAFRSFEIGFNPVLTADDDLSLAEAEQLYRRVGAMLSRGLDWAATSSPPSDNPAEAEAIIDALRELSPSRGSAAETVEVTGRVAEGKRVRPTLTKAVRKRADFELKRLRARVPSVTASGRVRMLDQDLFTFVLRDRSDPHQMEDAEVKFEFDPDFFDDVMSAFEEAYSVIVYGDLLRANIYSLRFIAPEKLLRGEDGSPDLADDDGPGSELP